MSARERHSDGKTGTAGIELRLDNAHLRVQALDTNAFRVRLSSSARSAPSSLVLSADLPEPNARVIENDNVAVVETAAGRVIVDRTTGGILLQDPDGEKLLEERVERRVLKRGRVRFKVASAFRGVAGERLFGTGQFQDGHLDIRDLPRRLTQVNTQISLPFVVSSRGWAILWHNYGLTEINPADGRVNLKRGTVRQASSTVEVTSAQGTTSETRSLGEFRGSFTTEAAGRYAFMLDVGRKMARIWKVAIDGVTVVDHDNFWLPPTTSWHTDLETGRHVVVVTGEWNDEPTLFFRPSAEELVLRSPVAEAIDYLLFLGRADEIIASYRRLTGEVPLLPVWAYGYIHCRERYHSERELLSNAQGFRDRGIPLDVIVQDWQYWGHHGWNAMRFDESDYPDPGSMVRSLHELEIRLMLSVWSRIDPDSEIGRVFAKKGYYIPETDWVDFFDPDAAEEYWRSLSRRLLSLGVDAWWLDATEPENDDLDGRTTKAGPGATIRNIYPLLVTRTVYEGLRREASDRRVFILTRSAFPGAQRYAATVWSGDVGSDWEAFRRQIPAGLNYVVSGLPYWTTDCGGFFRPGPGQFVDDSYRELFLRWFQFAVFCPLLRVHGYQTDTEPWRYGDHVESGVRKWLEVRYRLLPYIYSEAARISFEGSTLMRPLVMDFPDDDEALDCGDQFMFGPAFLVSPVTQPGARSRSVYLPRTEGGWYDFWSGSRFDSGCEVAAPAPLDSLPLFVRAGSIVSLGFAAEHAEAALPDPLELRVYPGCDGTFTLYEDGGLDYGYEEGRLATVAVAWNDHDRSLSIGERRGRFPGMAETRELRIIKVSATAGGGISRCEQPDAIVHYSGDAVTIDLSST